jgi:dihydropyrimidinase
MELLIRNGKVVNADSIHEWDIRCKNGKIVDVGPGLSFQNSGRIIDASGCLVFPGGVDPHVHMQLPTAQGISSDDFQSGSRAALMGGTTTFIDFVTPEKGQSLAEAIQARKEEAKNSLIDHSFHVSPVEWRASMEAEIRACVQEAGLRSFKVYMAYKDSIGLDDDALEKVLKSVAQAGGILAVHSELGDEIESLRQSFADSGKLAPEYHARSRPPELEARAVDRLIGMAERTKCPVYIVHVSSRLTLKVIEKALRKGLPVYAETCPQYLLLDDSCYLRSPEESIKYVMSPPLRQVADNQALWDALAAGLIRSVGTDHCPFTLQQKMAGRDDFRSVPNGAGGVEHRLNLLYTFGVLAGKISLEQFVGLISTNPAKIFGLYPRKGKLQPGADADLVVWDPEFESVIRAEEHHQHCDHNIYEGIRLKGTPKYIVTEGQLSVEKGVLLNPGQRGRFLKTNPV